MMKAEKMLTPWHVCTHVYTYVCMHVHDMIRTYSQLYLSSTKGSTVTALELGTMYSIPSSCAKKS